MAARRKRWLWGALFGALLASFATLVMVELSGSENEIQGEIVHRYAIDDPQFLRELGVLLGPPIVGGNRVANLENGDEIFLAMLEAIRSAERSITFESYIYWSGEIGQQFADALVERARAGVKVHVLIDWVGSQGISYALLEGLEKGGVHVRFFHPLRWYNLGRLNNRTHRKLLVVDGSVGFTGGVGIADAWAGDASEPDHWRDSHYRLEGPAVAQMQAAFTDNWIATTGAVLSGEDYFPQLRAVGQVQAQVFTSSPEGGADSMHLMYLLAIAAAEHTLELSAAYFLPDELMLRVLVDALERGVRVRILVPGDKVDSEAVRASSRQSWGELLAAGAEIWEYQPALFHVKMLVVDRRLVSVGSTNFDNRSFRLNDEANLNVYDREFAERCAAVFEDDLEHARRISLEEWRSRPWTEKLAERVSSLLRTQM